MTFTLSFAGGLIVILTSGLAVPANSGGVAHNMIYAIMVLLLLRHIEDAKICLDQMRRTSAGIGIRR